MMDAKRVPMKPLFNLKEKNVLVTGGGRGLGKTMALALADFGANVAIVDINLDTAKATADEIDAKNVNSLAIMGDVTNELDATKAITGVVDTWSTLDILVNNAGIATVEPAEDLSLETFKNIYDIDVNGVFNFSKAAFSVMSKQKYGNIINVASMAGISVLYPQEHVHYNSAKAAVIMITKSLAVEWAPFGIRVNALAPGYMVTPPVIKLKEEDPDRWEHWMSRVPMGRAGDPDELQGAVVYLASNASSYMTGHIMVIDGGYICR